MQDYVKIGGDITSLTNYKTASSFSYSNSIFKNLNVVSAENLVIPDGTICSNLFSDQTNLIIPPKNIPAINITNSMFTSMFKGCTKLEKPSIIGNNEPLIITSPSSLEYPMSNMFNNTNIKVYEDDPTGTLFMNLIGGSISESGDVSGMFSGTKGDFTGNPTVGHKYYYKTDEPEPSEDW
ncbi:MAG: hypothetical protein MJ224_00175 [archaeon]|nr:hypothetical protein [archaeon]